MSHAFFYITAAAYLFSTIVYIVYLFSRKDNVMVAARNALVAGFASHTAELISRYLAAGRTPALNLHESLTFFSWIVVLIYMVLLFRYRQKTLGAFIAPFVLFLIITASFLPKEIAPLPPILVSYWLPVHIAIALFGNALFAVAFFLSVMYVIQEHHLKTRRLKGLFFVLPPLDVLDELNYKCLQYGFVLLTLGIITGAIWSESALGTYWIWKPRQIWSLITWFLYAALLHGRLTSGWRGRKAAIFSGVAFAVLLGSFIIINLVIGGAHGLK